MRGSRSCSKSEFKIDLSLSNSFISSMFTSLSVSRALCSTARTVRVLSTTSAPLVLVEKDSHHKGFFAFLLSPFPRSIIFRAIVMISDAPGVTKLILNDPANLNPLSGIFFFLLFPLEFPLLFRSLSSRHGCPISRGNSQSARR